MEFRPKKELIIFFVIFLALSAIVYLFLNGGAYFRILRYKLFLNTPFAEADLKQPIFNLGDSLLSQADKDEKYYLFIPKISVIVPIVFPNGDSNENVLASLEEGVVLYPGSQLPGKVGRAVILGHSAKASWYRGKSAYVFSLLGELKEGDEIFILASGKKYTYKIFSSEVLTPDKTNETLSKDPENKSEIALITCWPVGSSSMRTLVRAKLESVERL